MYLSYIQDLLAVYPNVEVSAVKGLDFLLDRTTITYVVNVGGIALTFLTYADQEFSEGALEDFLEDIEARVNQIA